MNDLIFFRHGIAYTLGLLIIWTVCLTLAFKFSVLAGELFDWLIDQIVRRRRFPEDYEGAWTRYSVETPPENNGGVKMP